MESKENVFWDPLGEQIQKDKYNLQTQSLLQQAEQYKKHPYRIKRNRYLLLMLAAAIIIGYISINKFSGPIISVIIFSFVPFFIYSGIIQGFQQNFILFLMCNENNWIYYPHNDSERLDKLKSAYPDFFNTGHSQVIEDQIWGAINNKETTHFWHTTFTYQTGSGKHETTHKHNIFTLRMYKPVPVSFTLGRKGILSVFSSDLKTESEEFNKLFNIKVDTIHPDTKLLLLKILSPSVQVRLIQLANEFPLDKVGFYGDTMALDFHDQLWEPRYTNFFKEIKVDDRDKTYFTTLVETMTATPVEMLQFID